MKRQITLEDLDIIRQTRIRLLYKYITENLPIGWSVDQLSKIYDLTQAQIYAINHLQGVVSDSEIVSKFDLLTNELRFENDVKQVFGLD